MGLGPRVCTICNKCAGRDDKIKHLFCLTLEEVKAWDIANDDNVGELFK